MNPRPASQGALPRVLFLHWGRRGSISRHLLDLMAAASDSGLVEAYASISRQSEDFERFEMFGERLMVVDTFSHGTGALLRLWRLPLIAAALTRFIRERRIEAVVIMMPHVWTPLVAKAIRRTGARLVTIVHDADQHPGDGTGLVLNWLLRNARQSDKIVTLSEAVTNKLLQRRLVEPEKLLQLTLPDLGYGASVSGKAPQPGEPWRLLFLGRIMRYKGLSLCIDAVEILLDRGFPVKLGVFGEGPLGPEAERLARIGAEVVNRWLTEPEIAEILSRHHIMVLSYIEASQSGVAAAAFGASMPVVATPVGGLREQVRSDRNGALADFVTAEALAEAIQSLIDVPERYEALCNTIIATEKLRSADRFLRDLVNSIV